MDLTLVYIIKGNAEVKLFTRTSSCAIGGGLSHVSLVIYSLPVGRTN